MQTRNCPYCGGDLTPKVRSHPQHRHFFKVIAQAFAHWPEGDEFAPETPEHLRGYLLCAVGHRDYFDLPLDSGPLVLADALCVLRQKSSGYIYPRVHKAGTTTVIRVYYPKSIRWKDVGQKQFAPLVQNVYEVIFDSTKMTPDDLLKSHERVTA